MKFDDKTIFSDDLSDSLAYGIRIFGDCYEYMHKQELLFECAIRKQENCLVDQSSQKSKKFIAEWNVYGTCCDTITAISLIQEQTALTKTELVKIEKEMELMNSKFRNLLSKVQKRKDPHFLNLINNDKKNYQAHINDANSVAQLTSQFKVNQNRCHTKLTQIRSSSICSICSGRSQVFFEDYSLRISENQCRSILVECESAWMNIFSMIQLSHRYESFEKLANWSIGQVIQDAIQKSKMISDPKFKSQLVDSAPAKLLVMAENFESENSLAFHLKNCKSVGSNLKNCPFKTVKTLCMDLVEIIPNVQLRLMAVVSKAADQTIAAMSKAVIQLQASSRQLTSSLLASHDAFSNESSKSMIAEKFGVIVSPETDCEPFERSNGISGSKCAPLNMQFT